MLILGLLSMYFDAVVVFVTNSSLLFRLAVAILWKVLCSLYYRAVCITRNISETQYPRFLIENAFKSRMGYYGTSTVCTYAVMKLKIFPSLSLEKETKTCVYDRGQKKPTRDQKKEQISN